MIDHNELTPHEKARLLPEEPGVYRFYDCDGNIIYIGKAKNLKKRVLQYFQKEDVLTPKTRVMVSRICDLKHTVVESEEDAFLLENNLIKEFKPRYNILLKDDKTYPWIIITNEPFPRVMTGRRMVRDGSLYFGPYSSSMHARKMVEIIRGMFKLRSCRLNLEKSETDKGKYKVCLDYHIKKCPAPCTGGISREEYDDQIEDIKKILQGETSGLIRKYRTLMMEASGSLAFELAQEYKEKLEALEKHYSRSLIVNPSITDIDIFSLVKDGTDIFGNFLRIRNGAVTRSINTDFRLKDNETTGYIMDLFMGEVFASTGSLSKEIIVSHMPENPLSGKEIRTAQRGDKLKLLNLSIRNANAHKFEKLKHEEITDPEEHARKTLERIREDLNLNVLPAWMDCFDNSNIQGTDPVAACVVFKDAKPSKKDYRHFNVKTVTGANDYASMEEIVFRRYSRLIEEGTGLPQLIVIDGGKGQVGAAMKSLEKLGIADKVNVIGLAERLEEIIIPGKSETLLLGKNTSTLRTLMHIRDEAHRFGITFHRKKRSMNQTVSVLSGIPGIGPRTEEKLLKRFRSISGILKAGKEEVAKCIGKAYAEKIFGHLSDIYAEKK